MLTPVSTRGLGLLLREVTAVPGWSGSDRRDRLPSNWSQLRKKRLKLDGYRCTHHDVYGVRCAEPASEVDHKVRGDDHQLSNLRSLCDYHHQKKSSREGAEARAAVRRRHEKKFRRTEAHPGSL